MLAISRELVRYALEPSSFFLVSERLSKAVSSP